MSGSVHPTRTLFVNNHTLMTLTEFFRFFFVFSFFFFFFLVLSRSFPLFSFNRKKNQKQWTEHGLVPAVMLEKLFLRLHPPLLDFASFCMEGTSPQHNSILNHDTTLDLSYIYTLHHFRLYLLPTFIFIFYTGEKILYS